MRLLFLSPRECWPPTSGAKLRDYHFARGLAQGSELTYVFFGSAEAAARLAENLQPAQAVLAVAAPEKYTAGKILRGLVGKYPLPVQNYTSEEMTRRISQVAAGGAFDIVHLDSIHFAAYLPLLRKLLPRAMVVLNWHNIESELMERFAEATGSLPRKIYAKATARQMRKLEQRMLRLCDGHAVCSRREWDKLTLLDGAARIAVAHNGVDTAYFTPQPGAKIQKRLVFVGQMSYHANADGAAWFVREVWPAIRARDAEFTLSMIGSSPGAAVQALAKEPGVDVTGTVPDVRPFYSGAYAAIVPLLTGGGTRLKILEAMAAGTPVISTRLGAEGLAVVEGRELLLAEKREEWLGAVELLGDGQRRKELVESGRRLAVSEFDWRVIGKGLLERYREWLGERSASTGDA